MLTFLDLFTCKDTHIYLKSYLNISHYLSIMSTRKPKNRYDYNRLKQYCDENNIALTKDYESQATINRETRIEANCLNCSREVKKNFREFLNSGCFCVECTNINKTLKRKKFNLNNGTAVDWKQKIVEIAKRDNVSNIKIKNIPIDECITEEIKRDDIINFKCNCGIYDEKRVRLFCELDKKSGKGGECKKCIKTNQRTKLNETKLQNGIMNNYLDKIHVISKRDNVTEITIEDINIEDILPEQMNGKKFVNFKCKCGKYDSKSVCSFTEINVDNQDGNGGYCESCMKIMRTAKMEETMMKEYGVKNAFEKEEFKEKSKQSNLEKYGFEYATQSQIIKDKTKTTCMKKYGTKNPMQNAEIFDKQQKAGFKRKEYIFPSGRIDSVQGYEPQALDYFITNGGNEDDIITDTNEIESKCGKIFYHFEDGRHRYYPDLYQISTHKIIEVKSDYIFKKEEDKNLKKREACINAEINFEFWIMEENGNLLKII